MCFLQTLYVPIHLYVPTHWYVAFILSLELFLFDNLPAVVVGSICLYGVPCFEISSCVRFCTIVFFLHYIFVAFVLDFSHFMSSLFHAAK